MSTFVFDVTAPTPQVISSALGTGGSNLFSSPADIGKPVVLAAANNHVLASAGNEIAGFVNSVESFTVNGGYSFGGITVKGRVKAVIGPNQGGTNAAVGDYVVADTQNALGTVGAYQGWSAPGTAPSTPTGPTALVKTGAPTKKLWQIIRIVSGAGAAGSVVILERI